MNNHLVRRGYLFQVAPRVLALTAGLTPSTFAQRARLFIELVRRWRLVAVTGVLFETLLKFFDSGCQRGNQKSLLLNLRLLRLNQTKKLLHQIAHGINAVMVDGFDFVTIQHPDKLPNFYRFVWS